MSKLKAITPMPVGLRSPLDGMTIRTRIRQDGAILGFIDEHPTVMVIGDDLDDIYQKLESRVSR